MAVPSAEHFLEFSFAASNNSGRDWFSKKEKKLVQRSIQMQDNFNQRTVYKKALPLHHHQLSQFEEKTSDITLQFNSNSINFEPISRWVLWFLKTNFKIYISKSSFSSCLIFSSTSSRLISVSMNTLGFRPPIALFKIIRKYLCEFYATIDINSWKI